MQSPLARGAPHAACRIVLNIVVGVIALYGISFFALYGIFIALSFIALYGISFNGIRTVSFAMYMLYVQNISIDLQEGSSHAAARAYPLRHN